MQREQARRSTRHQAARPPRRDTTRSSRWQQKKEKNVQMQPKAQVCSWSKGQDGGSSSCRMPMGCCRAGLGGHWTQPPAPATAAHALASASPSLSGSVRFVADDSAVVLGSPPLAYIPDPEPMIARKATRRRLRSSSSVAPASAQSPRHRTAAHTQFS